jgi:hypothetical protein
MFTGNQLHVMDFAAPDRFHQPIDAAERTEAAPTTLLAFIIEHTEGAEPQPLPLHESAGEGLSGNDVDAIIRRDDSVGEI